MEGLKTPTLDSLQIFEENYTKIKDIVITQQALITDCAFRIEAQSKLLDEANTKFAEQAKELLTANELTSEQKQEITRLERDVEEAINSNILLKKENEKIIKEKSGLEERIKALEELMQLRDTYYSGIRNNQIRICRELIVALKRLSRILFDSQFIQSEFKSINIHKGNIESAIDYLENDADTDIPIDAVESINFSNKMYDWGVENIETISKLFRIYYIILPKIQTAS